MSKKTWIIGGVAVVAVLGATIIGRTLAGASAKGADAASSGQVTTLKVAHTQNYVPYDFIDEKGESDGYEVAVLKAVDEKLADYKFEYTGTSDDDLLIGLESGKYDIGTKGAWYTDERAKKFIIPSEPVGASIIGFTVRKEDEAKYKNIDDFAKNKGKLVPISPQNAQWNVINSYNEKHKDTPIELTAAESFKVADAYAWVLEGRYDAFFDIKLSFEKAVTAEDGSYHQYADKLSWFPYKGIPTYPLIHRDEKGEKFAKEYEKAIKELKSFYQGLGYSIKEGYLFKSLSPYQKKFKLDNPFTINGVSREFKKIESFLNIPYPLGSHSLRKTWGKNVYEKTLNIGILMQAFNHSSPQITLKYIGIEEEDINRLYDEFEI